MAHESDQSSQGNKQRGFSITTDDSQFHHLKKNQQLKMRYKKQYLCPNFKQKANKQKRQRACERMRECHLFFGWFYSVASQLWSH